MDTHKHFKTVRATGSEFAASLLSFKGKPVIFAPDYEPQKLLYDMYCDSLTIKAGRQVGKSLGLAGRMNIGAISQKYFTSLYIAPSQIQTKRFSSGYLDAFRTSPLINRYFINNKDPGNVFEKTYTNGSKIYLSYGQTNADMDRVRGLTADLLCLDEAQDIELSSIPVVAEILNTSKFGYKMYTGTSKSSANTLESLWQASNQSEFVQKCTHCGKWVIPNDGDLLRRMCVSKEGPVCPYCEKPFSFRNGQWVQAVPTSAKIGLHFPQLIFNANCTGRQWKDLYTKVKDSLNGGLYTPEAIDNEVFGLATDLGATSLSITEAKACCVPDWREWPDREGNNLPQSMQHIKTSIRNIVLGVDWSVSGSEGSHTVVTVLGVEADGRMILLYAKKLVGSHILTQVDEVLSIARYWNVQMIGSDRGVGVLQGELMQKQYGADKVVMVQYVTSSKRLKWDRGGNFLSADRTQAMDNAMMKCRLGQTRLQTPCWELTEGMWGDALSIYEEESRIGKRLYRKQPSIPDDWFHSFTFACTAWNYLNGEVDFTE